MKVKKYITRKRIYRLLLFVGVVLSAVLFDVYHQGSEKIMQEMSHRSQSSHSIGNTTEFCVNPISSFKLISGADKLFSGLVFAGSRNELLSAWYNHRSFHLFKAESPNRTNPFLLSAHFMKFNCCHQSSPDDSPTAA